MNTHVNKFLNKLLSVMLLGLVLLFAAAPGVFAQPEQQCTLNINYVQKDVPLTDVQFRLYRIADLDDNLRMIYTGIFSDLRLDAEALENSVLDLRDRVEAQNARPEVTMTTDRNGQASASGIAPGVFLLVGEPTAVGSVTYHVDWQILSLPDVSEQTGRLESNRTLRPKCSILPEGVQLIGIKTQKRWEDSGFENERPNAISVSLLRDGKVVSTVTLSEANNWSYSWNNLLPNAHWSVREDVPEGYKVEIEKHGNDFVLTNQRKNIEQTGQIWWPIVAVLGVGLVMIIAGVTLRRSGRYEA